MISILSYCEDANEYHPESPSHPTENSYARKETRNPDGDVGKGEPLVTVDGGAN